MNNELTSNNDDELDIDRLEESDSPIVPRTATTTEFENIQWVDNAVVKHFATQSTLEMSNYKLYKRQ